MRIVGTIAEFNPFHNGHQHFVDTIKKDKDTALVAVMSGHFVQRGEPALISKFARAKAATLCGVDLVLELPLPYSISTAMFFARGGMQILRDLGVLDTFCFGSESGDLAGLKAVASALNNPALRPLLTKELSKGVTFAAARQMALQKLSSTLNPTLLQQPNDTLGTEYILAAEKLGMPVNFQVIQRVGSHHDSAVRTDRFCSASELRKAPSLIDEKTPFMPPFSHNVYAQEVKEKHYSSRYLLDRAVVVHLRTLTPERLRETPDVSEGLEHRILAAANEYSTLDEILTAVKSKRYTHARLRRILLASYLGVTADLQRRPVPYIRVLGMSEMGAKVLSLAAKRCCLPLITSLKEAERLGPEAAELARLEVRAGDIFSLSLQRPVAGKAEYKTGLFKTF